MAGRQANPPRQAIAPRAANAPQPYPQGEAYADPYAGGYAQYSPVPAVEDPAVVRARKSHRMGSALYALSWIVIPVGILMLVGGLALMITALTSSPAGTVTGTDYDLLYGGLVSLGVAMAVRGVGLAMIWRADFTVKSRMVPDVPY